MRCLDFHANAASQIWLIVVLLMVPVGDRVLHVMGVDDWELFVYLFVFVSL